LHFIKLKAQSAKLKAITNLTPNVFPAIRFIPTMAESGCLRQSLSVGDGQRRSSVIGHPPLLKLRRTRTVNEKTVNCFACRPTDGGIAKAGQLN
jgi:hypothetical protein